MPEEALHNGIVQTATLSRHALHNAVVFCSLNESSSLIVVPLVRMKERRLSFIHARGSFLEHSQYELHARPSRGRMRDYLAVEQINYRRKIDSFFSDPELGDIRCPFLVRHCGAELSIEDVVRYSANHAPVGAIAFLPLRDDG